MPPTMASVARRSGRFYHSTCPKCRRAPAFVPVRQHHAGKPSMDPWLYYALAVTLVLVGGLCWLANLFSLPGNWALVGVAALFAYLVPATAGRGIGWKTIALLAALAALGEILEFAAGAAGAAKQGASRRAVVLSLVGAMASSVGGLGSLLAALLGGAAGAFAGAYLGETWKQRPHAAGMAVGKAAFVGRLWGTVGKFAVGAAMLGVLTVDALFV
ncbi:MAG: DUF456 domain-containing protein [Planctomycetota bacterium]|nr:MAG: DUF456 domain-containing protein [Planctomycetota bacterium]